MSTPKDSVLKNSNERTAPPLQRVFRPLLAMRVNDNRPAVVTIGKSREEVFNFFCNFKNLPRFAENKLAVEGGGPSTTWTIRAANKKEQIAALITRELVDISLDWTLSHEDGSQDVCSANFFDDAHGEGCIVTLQLGEQREPGKIAGVMDFFLGKKSKSESARTLRRLKALLETGEIATIHGQPSGREPDSH